MTKENNDDDSSRDDDAPAGSIPLGTVFETLSAVLEELENVDLDAGHHRSGSIQRDHATIDFDVNVGSINPAGESRRNRRGESWDIKGTSPDHEYRVRINEAAGELVVIADLPAVSADTIGVRTTDDGGALEIRIDGELLEAIPLNWDGATVTDVAFRNQVLEVHVEPPDAPDDTGTDGDDEDTNQ